MRRLLVLSLALFPIAATAQQGRVSFNHSVQYDFEVPENLAERFGGQIPTGQSGAMILLFNESESLMTPAPVEEEILTAVARRVQGLAERLKMGSSSRSDHEVLLGAYVSYADGTIVEEREFMGREFLVSDTRPVYEWRLTGEQSEFLGYLMQKATASHNGSTIEAFFTPQIPVQGGPGPYGGLPGMILVVSVDSGHELYSATEVDLSGLGGIVVVAPNEGNEVTRTEYEEIVAQRLEELRSERGAVSDRPRDAVRGGL
jgi:GLPGLI family protein